MDVGRGQDLGRLGEGDPVRRRGHRQSEVVDAPDLDGLSVLLSDLDEAARAVSVDPDSVFLPDDPDPSPSDDAAAAVVEASSDPPLPLAAFFAAAVAVERRSFLAPPDPLSCTFAAVITFRTGPLPHS